MKDIPVFTTEHGAASLVLSQIPMRQEAYVRLQAVGDAAGLIEDCVGFCKACGAERVFATGHNCLADYPLETTILFYQGQKSALPQTDACLWPVLPENVSTWREIYNRRMTSVPHAALIPALSEQELVDSNACYFVHRDGTLLGIGRVDENDLSAVVSECKGCGSEIVSALASLIPEETIRLEVASANTRAIRLYERLGFLCVGEGDRWVQIF